jgi:hypothetical protein
MAKVAKSKVSRPSAGTASKPKKQSNVKQASKLKAVAPPTKEVVQSESVSVAARQNVAQKLAQSIEKRKLEKGAAGGKPGNNKSFFGRPPGRRGRRPKQAAEYTPMQQEEDSYVLESEFERLEYDTGIRLKDGAEDGSFSLDRAEDFDEELNFDP